MTNHIPLPKSALCARLAAALPALAQDSTQRIEITGSAIKRIQAEGALPVQVIKREDIERTGATSVQELIQALSVIQGFTAEGNSVGGGGGGFTGAGLRALGVSLPQTAGAAQLMQVCAANGMAGLDHSGLVKALDLKGGHAVMPAGSGGRAGFVGGPALACSCDFLDSFGM